MPRRFRLMRQRDIGGVGNVADGIELWRGGWAIVRWWGQYGTWVLHVEGLRSVEAVHGHGGHTRIVFYSEGG